MDVLDEVLRHLSDEVREIQNAPVLFFTAAALVAVIIYLVLLWYFRGRIESLKARVELRDDQIADYKRQLDGASPDEAKARLDALEARLAANKPRRLNDSQRAAIVRIASRIQGSIRVSHNLVSGGGLYASDIQRAFEDAGWFVNGVVRTDLGESPHGIGIVVGDAPGLSPIAQAVFDALGQARIAVDAWRERPQDVAGVDAEIRIMAVADATS